ncbi:glycosyl transferase family group 2-domain-containing protein [Plectosphaerella plurivora]|uniref:Glycosyl transferase family group 2-domain-containing protein n=1 Tax=Plectosphaerella plurivora TaxID=936078 RepID=A0A9P9A8I6_9PEZI|nr:glycosyl transferase family group 2-domain-containing protein [Plectosphaerella plurivora]
MKAFKNYFIAKPPGALDGVPAGPSQDRASVHSVQSKTPSRAADAPAWASSSSSWVEAGPSRRQKGALEPSTEMSDLRAEVMVQNLWQDQLRRVYVSGYDGEEGVILKKARGDYICAPAGLAEVTEGFYESIRLLNVSVAVTVNSPVIQSIMQHLPSNVKSLPVSYGLHLQVLNGMKDLPRCHKHHFAAFIRNPSKLVVWDDHPETVLLRAQTLEQMIVGYIWRLVEEDEDEDEDGKQSKRPGTPMVSVIDLEPGEEEPVRRVKITSSMIVSAALCLEICCLGLGWRMLALEVAVDRYYLRLLIALASPFTLFLSLFFFLVIIANLVQLFGPTSCVTTNSKNYSGKPPPRMSRETGQLPHVTIQMPVYKEGLNPVIKPTVLSIKAAISTYEMQGGSANIFVNDDGMQLISAEQAQARRDFYEEHNIGWVSRPKHDPRPADPDARPFFRRGRFKKASNMNYGLGVTNRIEDRLRLVERPEKWTQKDEDAEYRRCLEEVLLEDEGRTLAEGNIRMGDYILLIDSDTRVPADCLLEAVSEMESSPEVAIIQYTSGVMNVSDSFFEKGVTWFTNMVYTSITFTVSMGDVPPFVGHNAILRWSALQDAASYMCVEDGTEKFWSESHVSEDFDMALRLQTAGYQLRFAAYTGSGFQEGVSLTVYDELMRWEKYAYGVSELLFEPFRRWPTRGPFTPLFRRFIWSDIHFFKKCTMMGYISTYYAIGLAWPMTTANYFITGWFVGYYDKFYLDSFAITCSVVLVFPIASNICLAVLRYRLGHNSILGAFWTNMKWTPLFTVFLGGISLHVSKALLCHLLSIDIQWGATSKEAERCNFLEEVPKIVKGFWATFVFCFLVVGLLVCGATVFPRDWRITDFASIFPLAAQAFCHFSLPVLLNPALMMFSF